MYLAVYDSDGNIRKTNCIQLFNLERTSAQMCVLRLNVLTL